MTNPYPWVDGEIGYATDINEISFGRKWGDGSDGGTVFSANGTITKPMSYTNCTINTSCTVTATSRQPMIIYCNGTLNLAGVINMNGNGTNGGMYGYGIPSSGSAGPFTAMQGCQGNMGGLGGGGWGGCGARWSRAGGGGGGGAGEGLGGGGGGALSAAGTAGNEGTTYSCGTVPLHSMLLHKLMLGGAGGGGGGGSGQNDASTEPGVTGGMGGNGGGAVFLFAKVMAWNGGTITANGNNGSVGTNGGNGGGGGGGGGGQGGVVFIYYGSASGTARVTVIGGTGGNGGTSGNGAGGGGGSASSGATALVQISEA